MLRLKPSLRDSKLMNSKVRFFVAVLKLTSVQELGQSRANSESEVLSIDKFIGDRPWNSGAE